MHVTVSSTFAEALRPEIEALVRAGFEGVECSDVEVHVKARSSKRRWYVARLPDGKAYRFRRKGDAVKVLARTGGTVESWVGPARRADVFSARTYDGVPRVARVRQGTAYLVTASIPSRPDRLTCYPVEDRYPGLKTAPIVRVETWQEHLLAFAAHEARHVEQFRHGLRRSEIDAEHWALARLEAWRRRPSVGDDDVVAVDPAAREVQDAERVVRLPPPVGR